mgnify:CR=1 FL=1
MIIAMVLATPGTGWGGMERHTADLSRALAALGHQVHVLAHRVYQSRFDEQVTFHNCPMQLGRRNPWLRYSLRRTVDRLAPDVVHAQGSKAAQLVSALRLPPGCQSIGTIHGSKSTHRPFLKLDKVIAVSTPVYQSLTHPRKFRVFNGIDPNERDRQGESSAASDTLGLPAGINVVAAGRLEPVKGFDRLIEAWPRVHERFPAAHLTLFGDGTQGSRLQELARERGCSQSVTLAGYTDNLMQVYSRADLLVISSEREGFPYVFVEALLANCPVVSTPVAGCQELLPEQAIAPDHQPSSLAALMIGALGDLEALKREEQSAFTFAREHLTLKAMAQATLDVYSDGVRDV